MPQTNLHNIFQEFVDKSTQIFKDRNALTAHFLPDKIPHRDKQMNSIASILAPSLKNARPSNVFIYGMTGTGKTLTVKYVSEELEKMASQSVNEVKVLYINCKMKKVADTEYRLVAELARLLGKELPTTGLPTEQIYKEFFTSIDSKSWVVIIVLDEIDALINKMGDEFLYNFTRINQDLKRAKISIIGITNDLNLIDSLDPRVKSSLSEEELLFPPYNATELQEILRQRSNLGFNKTVLSQEVIPKCAALAAQEHGDARRALDLLRVAGEMAERSGDSIVIEKHIDEASEKIDYDRITESVKILPKQTKIVLWSIIKLAEEEKGNILTGDVYNIYEDKCKECGLYPLTQRRVSDLISELDMLGIINAKKVSLGRYGRTREIALITSKKLKDKMKLVLETSLVI